MTVTAFPTAPRAVVCVGDLHGNIKRATEVLAWAQSVGADAVLALGDFGFGHPGPQTDRFLDTVSALAAEYRIAVLWVDGPFDHRPMIEKLSPDPLTGLIVVRPGIIHLPRGFRWSWGGRRWVALGGGVSPDAVERVEGYNWWRGELVSLAEAEAVCADGPADVLVCHDSPDGVPLPDESPPGADVHHRLIGSVADAVGAGLILHGGLHVRRSAVREGAGGVSATVIGLADDDSPHDDNAVVIRIPRIV